MFIFIHKYIYIKLILNNFLIKIMEYKLLHQIINEKRNEYVVQKRINNIFRKMVTKYKLYYSYKQYKQYKQHICHRLFELYKKLKKKHTQINTIKLIMKKYIFSKQSRFHSIEEMDNNFMNKAKKDDDICKIMKAFGKTANYTLEEAKIMYGDSIPKGNLKKTLRNKPWYEKEIKEFGDILDVDNKLPHIWGCIVYVYYT